MHDPGDVAALWRQLRRHTTRTALWVDLGRFYAAQALPWQAGYAARQALRLDPSVLPTLQQLQIESWQDSNAGDALLGRAKLSQAADLAARFQEAVLRFPGDWLTWLYLARLREIAPAPSEPEAISTEAALVHARSIEPITGESLHWMGVWRLNAHDAHGAISAFQGVLDIRPVRFGSMMYLGEALLRIGNIPAAHKAFERASGSANPEFLKGLAARVYAHNFWQEAIAILQKALKLRANCVPLLLALANIQSEVYALDECRETLRRIRILAPDHPEAALLAAGLNGRMGDARSHLKMLQHALSQGADPLSRIASGVAMTSLYQDDMTSAEVAELHRKLSAPIEAAPTPHAQFNNARSADKRLRIGYLTGDLHRQHPVNIFMLPVLLRHDRTSFEVSVYHTGTMFDEYTRQAQACVDHWREAGALSDAALRDQIEADGIDILVDLSGHTASHRLGVFAMRAAPVQATFLGYPHSTGMSRIDWLIGDPLVSPASHAQLFSEGIAQLPDSVFCWATVDPYPLPAPRAAGAPVVFGSFNNAMKLSPRTIALWSEVLRSVPSAQLLLKAPSLRDASVQARFTQLFADQDIGSERLILRGPSELNQMMQEYGDIDIALDPTPYNGGTTTLQALWMGVPVVTLLGHNFVSRMGASFLNALGEPTWVAEHESAYVSIACTLARRIDTIRSGRAALRSQMAGSALCDIDRYVMNFQALLRRMWIHSCEGGRDRLLRAQPPGQTS